MTVEAVVADHYSSGTLLSRITDALGKIGKDLSSVTASDLKPVDEFHIGGLAATQELMDQVPLSKESRVLDIGSGIGGTARFLTSQYGCTVHGIDLTPEFVETAQALCAAVGVPATFEVGSGTDLPVDDDAYDVATLIHVGMNIPDKQTLFAEAARALKPGGYLAVYDVMAGEEEGLNYPVPWASGQDGSFLAAPDAYEAAGRAAGFDIVATRNRGDFGREFFRKLSARLAESGPPPIGLPLIMGENAPTKIANMVDGLNRRCIAPVEIIFRLDR